MTSTLQTCISFAFLVVNVIILLLILRLNQQTGPDSSQRDLPANDEFVVVTSVAFPAPTTTEVVTTNRQNLRGGLLDASDILGWEFEYARITASEAMRDRHTMVNFYLLAVGVVASGIVTVLGWDTDLPKAIGTVLLWLVCGIGWLYFLKVIRLRQAWVDSAKTMNRIKEFCIQHAKEFDADVLRTAFRWQAHTLPAPHKPWTVFFYSAILIGFLDSVAYVAGGALLDLNVIRSSPLFVLGSLVLFGLVFFAFHVWLYSAFLKPGPSKKETRDD
ncbi:MAG: hypothetical protein ISS49_13810 [Anaerolineae bacterium]|nr:hypothetical protein [Anaerolineae bacterium]